MQIKKDLITYTAVKFLHVILKSEGLILNSIGTHCAPGHIRDSEARFLDHFLCNINEAVVTYKI